MKIVCLKACRLCLSLAVVKAQLLSNDSVQAGEDYVFPDKQDNLASFTGGDTQIMVPNSVLKLVLKQLPSSMLIL